MRRAFVAVEAGGKLDLVISLGLAGATGEGFRVGEPAVLTEIVDVQTGERFRLATGTRRLAVATTVRTAGEPEKRRLAATYGAVMVDMEAATVARLAAMREIPMCCFKAVSDAANAYLPEIDPFVDRQGQLSTARFAAYLVRRPRFWRPVLTLAKGSRLACGVLARSVGDFLVHKDWAFTNRTGHFLRDETAGEVSAGSVLP